MHFIAKKKKINCRLSGNNIGCGLLSGFLEVYISLLIYNPSSTPSSPSPSAAARDVRSATGARVNTWHSNTYLPYQRHHAEKKNPEGGCRTCVGWWEVFLIQVSRTARNASTPPCNSMHVTAERPPSQAHSRDAINMRCR